MGNDKGTVYDHHSIRQPDGNRHCLEGVYCYRTAYIVTLIACFLALGISIWGIQSDHHTLQVYSKNDQKSSSLTVSSHNAEEEEAEAEAEDEDDDEEDDDGGGGQGRGGGNKQVITVRET